MAKSNFSIEYIDEYLSGKLSESELSSFEQKMEEDTALQNAVKEVIRAKSASYLLGKEKWMEEMNQKFDEHLKPRRFNFWPLLVASTAAIMLVLAGIWWFQRNTPLAPEQVYAQNYQTPVAPEYRGEQKELDSLLAIAYSSYNAGEFEKSLQVFNQLSNRNDLPNKNELLFHQGIALLELGEEQEAMFNLAQVRGQQYRESAQYYLALILFKQGQSEEAQKILQTLADSDGSWRRKAKEILESLEE